MRNKIQFLIRWFGLLSFSTMAAAQLNLDKYDTSSVIQSTSPKLNQVAWVKKKCPVGFHFIAGINLCLDNSLNTLAYYPLNNQNKCPRNYEKILGVTEFCVRENLLFDINATRYVLANGFGRYCPEGFTRHPGSTLCIAKRLALASGRSRSVQLVDPIDLLNKINEVDKDTSIPSLITSKFYKLTSALCPPGFIKPPGSSFCIANNIVLNESPGDIDLPIPGDTCPEFWHKPNPESFCLPIFSLKVCGDEIPCSTQLGDSFRLEEGIVECPNTQRRVHLNLPTFSPFDANEFTTIPVYACAPPDKIDR